MLVKVTLFATLQKSRFHKREISLPESAQVRDLLSLLNISMDDVEILVINKKNATFNSFLRDSDSITIIPPIGGG